VGAVVGAAIGLSMDLGSRLGQHAAEAGTAARQALREHGPEIADAVTSAAAHGAEKIKEADLPGKVSDLAERARDSDTARGGGGGTHRVRRRLADRRRAAWDAFSAMPMPPRSTTRTGAGRLDPADAVVEAAMADAPGPPVWKHGLQA